MKLFEEVKDDFLKVSLNLKTLSDEDLIHLFKAMQNNDFETIKDSVNDEMKERYNVDINTENEDAI